MEILFHNLKHTLGPLSSVLDIVSYRNLALSVDGLLYIFVFKTHKYHTSNLKKLPYEWQDRVISNLNIFCSSYHSLYSLLNYIGWKAEELSPLLYINLSIAKKNLPFYVQDIWKVMSCKTFISTLLTINLQTKTLQNQFNFSLFENSKWLMI